MPNILELKALVRKLDKELKELIDQKKQIEKGKNWKLGDLYIDWLAFSSKIDKLTKQKLFYEKEIKRINHDISHFLSSSVYSVSPIYQSEIELEFKKLEEEIKQEELQAKRDNPTDKIEKRIKEKEKQINDLPEEMKSKFIEAAGILKEARKNLELVREWEVILNKRPSPQVEKLIRKQREKINNLIALFDGLISKLTIVNKKLNFK